MADKTIRIATWNVERVGRQAPRRQAQLDRMAEVDADVWVLTETNVEHQPVDPRGSTYSAISCPWHEVRRPEHERWTMIWSRLPIEPIADPAPHRRGTVAARIDVDGSSVVVYGTVIAWHGERTFDDGSPAKSWQVHYAEIERQAAEWAALARANPTSTLVLAGDFNQNRDGRRWYGTNAGRAGVTAGLEAAGLDCISADHPIGDGHVPNPIIDHICVTKSAAPMATISCWGRSDAGGQRLSDHPTIAVDLTLA